MESPSEISKEFPFQSNVTVTAADQHRWHSTNERRRTSHTNASSALHYQHQSGRRHKSTASSMSLGPDRRQHQRQRTHPTTHSNALHFRLTQFNRFCIAFTIILVFLIETISCDQGECLLTVIQINSKRFVIVVVHHIHAHTLLPLSHFAYKCKLCFFPLRSL